MSTDCGLIQLKNEQPIVDLAFYLSWLEMEHKSNSTEILSGSQEPLIPFTPWKSLMQTAKNLINRGL